MHMMIFDIEKLKFPSGRTVKRARQDAKEMRKSQNILMADALDHVAKVNGLNCRWSEAIEFIKARAGIDTSILQGPPVKINDGSDADHGMNPYRKLLVLGLNEALNRDALSLLWDGETKTKSGHFETVIAGENSIVSWADAGFGEIRLSVWWKYDHSKHPQANLLGSYRESFKTAAPLAKRSRYKEFVGVVCSVWLERDKGRYLQGHGNRYIHERYTRKGELVILKAIPDPVPNGFEIEGPFHM
jgi:hypothetical protein